MRAGKRRRRHSLAVRFLVGTALITLSAVGTVAALRLVFLHLGYKLPMGGSQFALTVFFVALVVGGTAGIFYYNLIRGISRLTQCLGAVAGGDYSVRLDPARAGPLAPAYESFNQMGEELQSVQTLRRDFINNFSHEFKTPIAAVRGFAELLQESDVSEEDRRQYVQIIVDESSRLAGLADSALLLTRLEAQQAIPDRKSYALDEQIKRCAILLSPQWEKKHIAFSAELEEAVYTGSEELMDHVWLNLLGNAIKYTPEGGEIAVTMQTTPDAFAVRVSDTGIGMSEETRRHVFDKYYQGAPSNQAQGLGLGLSIVHRIVELCGGSIQVQSVENQGSAFTVRLPRER